MSEITLYNGDCIEKMKLIPDNSIDSIVTDPPYELGFMDKKWDNTGIAYNVEMWKECLRVLKPGGHLLAFSGTRTYHRMAVAIEDAGFKVRDMIEWVYGSGFPKSLNIGKVVDKLQGNEREFIGKQKEAGTTGDNQVGNQTFVAKNQYEDGTHDITKGTSEWEGWGTALKPAHEPICMARKPLAEKTVAENCLKYGTGGINIDESRVGFNKDYENFGKEVRDYGDKAGGQWHKSKQERSVPPELGRFPANLIHDNSEEVRECFPGQKSGARSSQHKIGNEDGEMFNHGIYGKYRAKNYDDASAESCNASRFFKSILYYPKVSKSERNKGMDNIEAKEWKQENSPNPNRKERPFLPVKNNHPTVKPIKLMQYLIKMVTPKNGTVLDPFMGSGSTGVASKLDGFNFIGIEKETEYCDIAKARINTIVDIK